MPGADFSPIEISDDDDDFQPKAKLARTAPRQSSQFAAKANATTTPVRGIADVIARPMKMSASKPRAERTNVPAGASAESSVVAAPAEVAAPEKDCSNDEPIARSVELEACADRLLSGLNPAGAQPECLEGLASAKLEGSAAADDGMRGTMLTSIMTIEANALATKASANDSSAVIILEEDEELEHKPAAAGSKRAAPNRLERFMQKAKLKTGAGNASPAPMKHAETFQAPQLVQSRLDKYKGLAASRPAAGTMEICSHACSCSLCLTPLLDRPHT